MNKVPKHSAKTTTLPILGFVIFGFLLVTSCRNEAAESHVAAGAADKDMAAKQVADAEPLYEAREDLAKARVAVATLRQANTTDGGSYEAAWKLARASFYVGDHTEESGEADEMFAVGIGAGRAAVKLQPDKPEGHFWLGANLGGKASRATISNPGVVNEIRSEMEAVIKIDEKYQSGSAYIGLGRMYLQAPKMLGGDTEKAIDTLKKGLAISPTNSMMKYYLAEAYASAGRDAEAKKLVDEVLKHEPDPKYVAEHKDAVKKATKLQQKLASK